MRPSESSQSIMTSSSQRKRVSWGTETRVVYEPSPPVLVEVLDMGDKVRGWNLKLFLYIAGISHASSTNSATITSCFCSQNPVRSFLHFMEIFPLIETGGLSSVCYRSGWSLVASVEIPSHEVCESAAFVEESSQSRHVEEIWIGWVVRHSLTQDYKTS